MHQAQAFIAMPFDQKFHSVYKTIRAACESLNIKVIRIDEVWAREDIYKQIEEEILKSDFLITDFTGDRMLEVPNPNVVHEAAFARTKKKYLILMAQDHKCLPFDWRTRPAIIYQMTPEGLKYLEERLVIGIQALMEKEDFGHDYEEATANNFMHGYPQQMPQHYMPMNYATAPMNYTPSHNTTLSEIESLLITKQGQPVAVNSNHNSRLPKGFSKKKDSIVCRIDNSEMVHVPTAEFKMGFEDEEPEHQVVLSEYLIDKYPVTNKQFAKFIDSGGYQFQGFWSDLGWQWRVNNSISLPAFWDNPKFNDALLPVVGVSWYEAMAYAAWVGKHLPTEAQWELAAKGTDGRQFPWGNEAPCSQRANFRGQSNHLTSVNNFDDIASAYGCIDMAGNAWEWCYDWYDDDYYEKSCRENPVGPPQSEDEEKVCRGGAFSYDIDTLKVYHRFFGIITLRDKSSGFRCARIL
ncbi:formylglycine-generating enzyme family protein [Candidatus Uabimicrobium sp. HlEnr_7]|uniref:formylglycine-generating enzyme family protein n=1 Tax=Candidatus Uabimicrobium helgolandensis TaxID=3095367 RepID=UPI003558B971